MDALGLTLPELMWRAPDDGNGSVRIIPMLRNRIGPGMDTSLTVYRGYMPFATRIVERLVDPVVAQLGPDLVLPSAVSANDLILLDQNPEIRERPRGDSCWVVAEATGLRVRYVKWGGTRVYLANESTVRDPKLWDAIPLHGQGVAAIVKARIVWIGRELADLQGQTPAASS